MYEIHLSVRIGNGRQKSLEIYYKAMIIQGVKISYGHKIMRAVKLQCSTIYSHLRYNCLTIMRNLYLYSEETNLFLID